MPDWLLIALGVSLLCLVATGTGFFAVMAWDVVRGRK